MTAAEAVPLSPSRPPLAYTCARLVADIFLSYAQEDAETAGRLATLLGDLGWSVFWAGGIPAGAVWDETVEHELRACRCVVVLWSAVSVRSQWVRTEANFGLKAGTLVPVSIDGTEPPLAFQLVEAAQLQTWTGGPTHPEVLVLTRGISRCVAPTGRVAAAAGAGVALTDAEVRVPPVRWSRWVAGVATLGLTVVLTIAFWLYRQDGTGGEVPAPGLGATVRTNVPPASGAGGHPEPGDSGVAMDAERQQREERERKQKEEAARIAKDEADRRKRDAARQQQQERDRQQIQDVLTAFRDAYSARNRAGVLSSYPEAPDDVFTAFKSCSRIALTFEGPVQIEFFAESVQSKAEVASTQTCWKTTAERKPLESRQRESFNLAKGRDGWFVAHWFRGPAQ
jgi:hypothetical protein